MNTETLHFKIGLSGSSEIKQPKFNILVNDNKYISTKLSGNDKIEYFEFDVDVNEGDCKLIIEFLNKTQVDTILNNNGHIIHDLLLNIESIEIDEVDIGSLLWTASDYRPDYPDSYKKQIQDEGKAIPESVKNCVNLGWNGQWILPFRSPFYIWLLENI